MNIRALNKNCFEMIRQGALELHPREFLALLSLGDDTYTISELVLLPQMVYGNKHAIFNTYMAPFDRKIVGTVHSHPNGNASPSEGDLHTFRKYGKVHIIIASPYRHDTWKAYGYNGKEIELDITE